MPQETSERFLSQLDDKRANQRTKGEKKRPPQTPLQRGWTSARPQGRSFGPPLPDDPLLVDDFKDFDCILVQQIGMMAMDGKLGRQRSSRVLMLCGNGDGLCGYTLMTGSVTKPGGVYQRAMNRAGKRICFFERFEDRTVFHDFFTRFGTTRITVEQKPPGHGLVGHRIIIAICKLVGLKDLRAKIEGTINPISIVKAFFLGLLRQRTHQALANEKRLHLVEYRQETGNYPRVNT